MQQEPHKIYVYLKQSSQCWTQVGAGKSSSFQFGSAAQLLLAK